MLPGKAVVEMAPFREQTEGGLFLPDRAAGKYRPNVGIVLCIDDEKGVYRPGDAVVVRAYDGLWLTPYKGNHYQTDGEIRMYGLAHDMDEDKTVVWDLYDQIVGWYEENELVPGPHWTLIRRAKQEFAVEASITVWADHGHVLGGDFAGNKRILFAATHPDDLLHIQWTGEDDLWMVPSKCVLAVCND